MDQQFIAHIFAEFIVDHMSVVMVKLAATLLVPMQLARRQTFVTTCV